MEHRIIGTTLPVLEISLKPGEKISSIAGELSWMSGSIEMQTSAKMGFTSGFAGIKRVAGGGLFFSDYIAKGADGIVAFSAKVPGQILTVPLSPGQVCYTHRHGFMCGTPDIEVGIGFQQNLGAGIFGGAGFILQKLSGSGTAFIELSGEVVSYDLKPGDSMLVHPGHVGMVGANVRYELTRLKGIRNMLFGGDGIFLVKLTGPGRIWLQSMTIAALAHAIQPYLETRK